MNSQQLLFINFIIFIAIILLFVLGRSKPKQTLRLDMLKSGQKEPEPEESDVKTRMARDVGGRKTVLFIYNGHEWEAHQVLGVSVSCDLEEVTTQYQHLVKTSDVSTLEFYESAYLAILKSKSTRS